MDHPESTLIDGACHQPAFASRHGSRRVDRVVAALAVLSGAALAAALALTHASFWSGWMFYWAPQAAVLALLFFMYEPPGPPIVAGAALALAAHLGMFAVWAGLMHHADLAVWLHYYAAIPGAAGGALVAATGIGDRQSQQPSQVAARTSAYVAIGILAGQLFAWALLRGLERS